ncbi:MAG: hypothetical protein Q8L24_01025 [bacterium]|nr:hypothetical protein [bacterium]
MKRIIGVCLMVVGTALVYGGAVTIVCQGYPVSAAAVPLTLGGGCFFAGLLLITRAKRLTEKKQ